MVSIRLEKWASAKDGDGDFKETITKYNLFAEVISSSSSKGDRAGSSKISQTVQFKIRFRPDFKVSGNWKVVYDGKRYSVDSIEKENQKRFYWIITANGF